MITITINPTDAEDVRNMLSRLGADEANTAMVRSVNTTMDGVRTDGTAILKDHFALTATAIRASFKINKAKFRDPSGVVSCSGTFIRLKEFNARPTLKGVTVKILTSSTRALVAHAFFAKLGAEEQVYWRRYKGPRKAWVRSRKYGQLPFDYRFPMKSLYGPRIQDYLGDPLIFETLTRMAGERLSKNMEHEVEYLLALAGRA